MNSSDLLGALDTKIGIVAAIVTAFTTIGAAIVKLRGWITRSRLIVPNAFPLPDVPGEQVIFDPQYPDLPKMLVGRASDIRDLMRSIQNRRLNFMSGESGSGKSTLLKLGLARALNQSGYWIPIYVDVWGLDWVRGPRKSLADSVDFALRAMNLAGDPPSPVVADSVFARLGELRAKCGRRPVILFDQLDDYQNQHRSLFRNSETELFLTPDELCAANPFWKDFRDLLLTTGDPVHVLFATRDDAESGLHCFRFEEPGVYPPLGCLAPEDASLLIQRLALETVVRNPENGFNALVRRLIAELSARRGSVLPMHLRIALAGIGRLTTGPLTPSRFDREGGVDGLGAKYIESAIRDTPGAWEVLNSMAQRTAEGRAKAVPLTRSQMQALLPPGATLPGYLDRLVAARILRRRLADSDDEIWQLYHDYLADAIVALDRRKRKWRFLLSDAAERFRLSDRLTEKWARLLSPGVQLQLLWRRFKDHDFRYGEYAGFAGLSLIRLLVNPWTLSLAVGALGWAFWQETSEAQEIVNAFHQGAGHEKDEYDALWRLASSRSDRTIRAVFEDFLSTQDNAVVFNRHSAIQASLGLRTSSLDALRSMSVTGHCVTLAGAYLDACSTVSRLSGEQEGLANRMVELLGKATGNEAVSLSSALAALAPQVKGDQAERGANRIAELLGKATGLEAADLGSALAALAPQVKGDQAERLANRIAELLGKATGGEAVYLDSALAALAPQVKDDQAERLANRIAELLGKATGDEAVSLGSALAAVAPQVKGDQAERGANRIAELMGKATGLEAAYLGSALAAVAPQVKGDQAERGANRMVELLGKATGFEAANLGRALAALAPQVKGDQAERGANRMVELLGKATGLEAAYLGRALAALAPQVKGDQAERGANRMVELMGKATGDEAENLGRALAAVAPQVKGDQAERLANRIAELMGKATGLEAANLGSVLAALAPQVKGLANRMVELLGKATGFEAASLGRALAAVAPQVKGDQAERGANRMVELLGKATGFEAASLGSALAALAPQVKGDQAERGANRIVELLGKATGDEAANLGSALAALAPQVKGDQEREALLAKFVDQRRAAPCDIMVVNAKRSGLLVDMLKWPVCTGRDGIMLRIAELQGSLRPEFGEFGETGERSTFHADLRRFIAWLKTQQDSNGKPFDVDSPPVWSPGHTPGLWRVTGQKP